MKTVIKIGRDNSNDIVINEPRISREHAIISALGDGQYEVKDLGSTNGTFVNSQRVTQKIITPGDKLEVANFEVNWYEAINKSTDSQIINEKPFSKIKKSITVGSDLNNDLVIDGNFITGDHAIISLLQDGSYYIKDLNSTNGTFVNGARIGSKNFTKTDIVKIATTDLPQDWFMHKKLKTNFVKDNKKGILISMSCIVLVAGSILIYVNRCKWLGYGCNLTAQEIASNSKNSLVYIAHEYFYIIELNGVKYYVGKNKEFGVTEANTDKKNLAPYNKITGLGSFVNSSGTILTSSLITNPWLNSLEVKKMLKEVEKSRTIPHFSANIKENVCGETARLKWIPNGVIDNEQNYVDATSQNECVLTDSTCMTIQPVKSGLPDHSTTMYYYFKKDSKDQIHKTSVYYYSSMDSKVENEVVKDTFYASVDSLDANTGPVNISKTLPILAEGSAVINERGEWVGIVQARQIVFLPQFIEQLTTKIK